MKLFKIFVFLFSLILFSSCGSEEKDGANLPSASGRPGDMFIIIDSTQRKGPLGDALNNIFNVDLVGLPRDESIFHVNWIDPRKLNFVLKQRRNLIFAVSLDQRSSGAAYIKNLFTEESVKKIKSDSGFFVRTVPNVYAKGQEVMYLFGETEEGLIRNINKNSKFLVDYFNRTEKARLTNSLLKAGQVKGVSEFLQKNFECDIKVPFGYKLADKTNEFLWVRQINPKDDKDIFIARKPYRSQDQFKADSLINFRDKICKKYLFEDPAMADSYLMTETTIPFLPVSTTPVAFNGHYSVEMRGLWRTNNKSMGGPFLGYALVDEAKGTFYYIEGFTFSPGKTQREIMRELETILFTFRISSELSKTGS
jgi:hypothetical protein